MASTNDSKNTTNPENTNLLTTIAEEILHIPTLEARNRDDLDFHEVSVWKLRKALAAAYYQGKLTNESPQARTTRLQHRQVLTEQIHSLIADIGLFLAGSNITNRPSIGRTIQRIDKKVSTDSFGLVSEEELEGMVRELEGVRGELMS